jgi:hypothetical protein
MKLKRLVWVDADDKHPECCAPGCQLWNDGGNHNYCGSVLLEVDPDGKDLRTEECLRDAVKP